MFDTKVAIKKKNHQTLGQTETWHPPPNTIQEYILLTHVCPNMSKVKKVIFILRLVVVGVNKDS